MIVIIADDLSGAAELAGVAAARGLRAEVQLEFEPASEAEVIALDTETRALPADEAACLVEKLSRAVAELSPEWIYKKTDSVLRGNARAEIESILAVTRQRRAVLIPANPGKGRTIRGGIYHVNGVPLSRTSFARDPVHPRWTSSVGELVGESGRVHAQVMRLGGAMGREGIWIPDVESAADVACRAAQIGSETLPAGGVEFFEALLELRSKRKDGGVMEPGSCVAAKTDLWTGGPVLWVCGSAAAWEQDRAGLAVRKGFGVMTMPEDLFRGVGGDGAVERWAGEISGLIERGGNVLMAVGRTEPVTPGVGAAGLVARLAETVARVSERSPVSRHLMEGGETAAACVRRLGWKRFEVVPTRWNGVGALRPAGTQRMEGQSQPGVVFIKPGSYPWPE